MRTAIVKLICTLYDALRREESVSTQFSIQQPKTDTMVEARFKLRDSPRRRPEGHLTDSGHLYHEPRIHGRGELPRYLDTADAVQ